MCVIYGARVFIWNGLFCENGVGDLCLQGVDGYVILIENNDLGVSVCDFHVAGNFAKPGVTDNDFNT